MWNKGAGITLLLALTSVLVIGCGGNDPGTGGKPVQIKKMNLRPVADNNKMLATRYAGKVGGFSIRPPAGWEMSIPVNTKKHQFGPMNGPALFTAAVTGETMLIFAAKKNVGIPTVSMLAGIRDDIVKDAGKSPNSNLVGTDLFSYQGRFFVQSIVQEGSWVTLHLSIISQAGRLISLEYRVKAENYQNLSRAMEASIASFSINQE